MSFCDTGMARCTSEHLPLLSQPLFLKDDVDTVQDGFSEFVSRCEGADFEDANMAHQGKMSLRDLQKMRQNPGLAYATKPASELAMDNREVWQVWPSDSAATSCCCSTASCCVSCQQCVSLQVSTWHMWSN